MTASWGTCAASWPSVANQASVVRAVRLETSRSVQAMHESYPARASARMATAVSSSHRMAELPGWTASQ